jgi:hypothetical protein
MFCTTSRSTSLSDTRVRRGPSEYQPPPRFSNLNPQTWHLFS